MATTMNTRQLQALPQNVVRQLPKHLRLRYALQERLGGLAAGEALPTIAALQAEFSLAQGTVVRVLRELQHDGLVEGRHGSGYYATGQTRLCNVAIYFSVDVLHPETGAFPRLLLKGLERAAGEFPEVRYRHYFAAGTDCQWHDRVCALEHDVRRHLVDGVILFGLYGGEFGDLPVPVAAWQLLPQVQAHVLVDQEALVRQGLEALRARDCRAVAYLGGHQERLPAEDSPYFRTVQRQQRLCELFRHEAARLGLKTRPAWTVPGAGETGVSVTAAHAAARFRDLWASFPQKPDGLLSTDDYRTRGALAAMAELGVVPGRDLLVASHVNRGSDLLDGQAVIRLEVDPAEIAHALLQAVTALMAGRHHAADPLLVAPRLVAAPAVARRR